MSGILPGLIGSLRALRTIIDLFTRTAGSLGTSTSGHIWTALRGTWTTNGSQATSSDTATTYPVGVIPFAADSTLTASTSNGCGLVFWQTGSGDWWATTPYSYTSLEPYCIANSCCTGSNTCASNSCCTGSPSSCISNSCCTGSNTCVSNSCCTGSVGGACISSACCSYTYSCSSGYVCGTNCTQDPDCGRAIIGAATATCVSNSCCSTTSNTCVANSCCTGSNTCASNACCSTGNNTRYYWAIKIIRAVAGVFTQQKTQDLINVLNSSTEQLAGIKVVTSASTITVKGYSDMGLTAQVGTDVTHTDGTAVRGSGVGIIKTDSANNQGSTIDDFTATL